MNIAMIRRCSPGILLILTGFFFAYTFVVFASAVQSGEVGPRSSLPSAMAYSLLATLAAGIIATPGVFYACAREWSRFRATTDLPLLIVVCGISSMVWVIAVDYIVIPLFHGGLLVESGAIMQLLLERAGRFIVGILLFGTLWAGTLLTLGQQAIARSMADARRARRLAEETRLRSIRSKMNAHFLFNALNTIGELAATNPRVAERAISDISRVLRMLVHDDIEAHPISEEIRIVESYIDFQRLRFGDAIEFETHMPSELADCQIPVLLLQPFVENSIAHALRDEDQQLLISLRTTSFRENDSDFVQVDICDNGRVDEHHPVRKRIGIGATEERLMLYFGRTASLETGRNVNGDGFVVSLKFPRELQEENQ